MPFNQGVAPAWAVAWGDDAFGAFADLEVQGVVQRMRWIRPVRFWMGSPEDEVGRLESEGPRHLITLTDGFWLGDTPVTQALWMAVMNENPSRREEAEAPVESVSHEDADRFMAALATLATDEEAGSVWQLPSEAQWERGSRGDDPRARGLATWRGGLEGTEEAAVLDAIAWYGRNSDGRTHPVGRKAPNDLGLHDMLGNVWEWCADDLRTYTTTFEENPLGRGRYRVFRGGSWDGRAQGCRAACRDRGGPGNRVGNLGLRLARGPAHSQ